MKLWKLFQKQGAPAAEQAAAMRPDARENSALEQFCTQRNLCFWGSRDVPHTQLRFLSVWTDKATQEAHLAVKVLGTEGARYWVYESLPADRAQDTEMIREALACIFAANGAANAPLFPALPSLLQIAEQTLTPPSVLKPLVFQLMRGWDGAGLRNFNELIRTNVPTDQALRRRLGREWNANWSSNGKRVAPPAPQDLELWWAIVTDTDRVPAEVALCSRLESQWRAMQAPQTAS